LGYDTMHKQDVHCLFPCAGVSFSYPSPFLFRFILNCLRGSFSIKNETDRDRTLPRRGRAESAASVPMSSFYAPMSSPPGSHPRGPRLPRLAEPRSPARSRSSVRRSLSSPLSPSSAAVGVTFSRHPLCSPWAASAATSCKQTNPCILASQLGRWAGLRFASLHRLLPEGSLLFLDTAVPTLRGKSAWCCALLQLPGQPPRSPPWGTRSPGTPLDASHGRGCSASTASSRRSSLLCRSS
jgi:hypothetical protein